MVEVTGRREGDRESRILLMASEALGARVRDEADAAVAITFLRLHLNLVTF